MTYNCANARCASKQSYIQNRISGTKTKALVVSVSESQTPMHNDMVTALMQTCATGKYTKQVHIHVITYVFR